LVYYWKTYNFCSQTIFLDNKWEKNGFMDLITLTLAISSECLERNIIK